MKLKAPLQSRRNFLNILLWGWLTPFLCSVFYPMGRFLFPSLEKEPDEVRLPWADYKNMPPNSSRIFAWGSKMGILVMTDSGNLRAFKGVCTHLTCNVTYLPDKKKFHCPCHEGWFDENGINIAGPPPRPLQEFFISMDESDLVISREKTDAGEKN